MATPKKPGAVRGRPRVYPVGMTREEFTAVYNAIQRRKALSEIVRNCGTLLSFSDLESADFDEKVRSLLVLASEIIGGLAYDPQAVERAAVEIAVGLAAKAADERSRKAVNAAANAPKNAAKKGGAK